MNWTQQDKIDFILKYNPKLSGSIYKMNEKELSAWVHYISFCNSDK